MQLSALDSICLMFAQGLMSPHLKPPPIENILNPKFMGKSQSFLKVRPSSDVEILFKQLVTLLLALLALPPLEDDPPPHPTNTIHKIIIKYFTLLPCLIYFESDIISI